jgi:hypothetical protein
MAASKKLKDEICYALSTGVNDCLSISKLIKRVKEKIYKIEEALNDLITEDKVRKDGKKYCLNSIQDLIEPKGQEEWLWIIEKWQLSL